MLDGLLVFPSSSPGTPRAMDRRSVVLSGCRYNTTSHEVTARNTCNGSYANDIIKLGRWLLFKVVSYKLSLMKMLGQVIQISNYCGIETIIVT